MAELVFNKVFPASLKEKVEQEFRTRTVSQIKKMTVEEIINEFPKIAKNGEFVQAMVMAHGNNRGRKIYAIINKVINRPFSKHH